MTQRKLELAKTGQQSKPSVAAKPRKDPLLEQFRLIHQTASGCDTPAEQFICDLVLHHSARALTPEFVRELVEEFEEDFERLLKNTRRCNSQYPEFLDQKGDSETA